MGFDEEDWRGLQKTLLIAPHVLKKRLREDFLHVIDFMRPLKRDDLADDDDEQVEEDDDDDDDAFEAYDAYDLDFVYDWWIELGRSVGLDESELRLEHARECKRTVGREVIGCSWEHCLRFRRKVDLDPLYQCAGCRKKIYCGALCQKR